MVPREDAGVRHSVVVCERRGVLERPVSILPNTGYSIARHHHDAFVRRRRRWILNQTMSDMRPPSR